MLHPRRLMALLLLVTSAVSAAAPPKMITTILIDDLGSYDTAVNNPDIAWLTPTLQKLSHEEGLRLNRFYVNKYCSPTRRAYLTGRFPVSVSMIQAQPCDNTLPLQATLLSEKLKQAPTPWANHFVGKGHVRPATPTGSASPPAMLWLAALTTKCRCVRCRAVGLSDERPPAHQPRLRQPRRLPVWRRELCVPLH